MGRHGIGRDNEATGTLPTVDAAARKVPQDLCRQWIDVNLRTNVPTLLALGPARCQTLAHAADHPAHSAVAPIGTGREYRMALMQIRSLKGNDMVEQLDPRVLVTVEEFATLLPLVHTVLTS